MRSLQKPSSDAPVSGQPADRLRRATKKVADAERQLALKKAEAELAAANVRLQNAEQRRLAQLPPSERRSMPPAHTAGQTKTPTTVQPMTLVPPGATLTVPVELAHRLTPEQVRKSRWWKPTALAFAECFASVRAGAILAGVWEWDRDHDGVPNHLQQLGK